MPNSKNDPQVYAAGTLGQGGKGGGPRRILLALIIIEAAILIVLELADLRDVKEAGTRAE